METPEQIDSYRMELLAHRTGTLDDPAVKRARTLLPPKSEFTSEQLTVPIHNSKDLLNFFRAIYRLNSEQTTSMFQKQRVSVAFEALKSLTELNGGLSTLVEDRGRHTNRENVRFRIGQVVQHQHERWRGVVAAWERPKEHPGKFSSSPTSLTQKDYTDDTHVRYDVILDAGDAHSMAIKNDWTSAAQADLLPVSDKTLLRIRSNTIATHFDRFDAASDTFVPGPLMAFEYPADLIDASTPMAPSDVQMCEKIVAGVKDFASRLQRFILDETTSPSERGMSLLSNVQTRLQHLATGEHTIPLSLRLGPTKVTPSKEAATYLRELLNLQLEVFDVNLQRKLSIESKGKLQYSIGDVVEHKKYGFRGVIVAWDATPKVDVTMWDGLQDIDDPMQLPFYHVIPDQGDCIRAFGGERPLRYVCEENLQPCAENRSFIAVDLEPEWKLNASASSYAAPSDVRFKYGEDMDDDGVTERCMNHIQDEMNSVQLMAREGKSGDSVAEHLSQTNLLRLLKIVDNLSDSVAIQETIKEMRKAHVRKDVRWRLETGVSSLMSGKANNALEIYQSVVNEDANYAEGWNKIGTCEFMIGKTEEALISTNKALEQDPLNFQALNGLGLIYFGKNQFAKAIDCFRKSIVIDPWSPVSSKLSVCHDLLDNTDP
jgi:hemimethylated DNA binding protein